MTHEINETHDPNIISWVESANTPDTDFPIQNLPFCVFRQHDSNEAARVGVAIGAEIFDVAKAYDDGLLEEFVTPAVQVVLDCKQTSLNKMMTRDKEHLSAFRLSLSRLLRSDAGHNSERLTALRSCLTGMDNTDFLLTTEIGDYTDFYCSIFHATNVGSMFRPDNPLLPNYKYIPIGYHGRASSIVVSGTNIKRPRGQIRPDAEQPPIYAACKNLDYEMEVGFFIGMGNELGETIPLERAEEHIFGACLVNDWSARDVQSWEYQPLGPFLAKSFATTVSPFVVAMEALAPFRVPAFTREANDPQPLPYLASEDNQTGGGINLEFEVYLSSSQMRETNIAPVKLSTSNLRDLYWTPAQMLTHHASNGCNLLSGDLFASGTVSGKEKTERGCLLELTWRGTEPLTLPTDEERRFLLDGDEVIMRGRCSREGYKSIGFGECRGIVTPAA